MLISTEHCLSARLQLPPHFTMFSCFANSYSADLSCLCLLPVCPSLSPHSSSHYHCSNLLSGTPLSSTPLSVSDHATHVFCSGPFSSSSLHPCLFLLSALCPLPLSHSFSLFSSFPSHPLSSASLSPFLLFFPHYPRRLCTLLLPHPPMFFSSLSPSSLFVCWQAGRGFRAL